MIKRLLLLPLLLWLGGCASQYSISEQQVQQYLNDKVVKQFTLDSGRMLVESGVQSLEVSLGEQPERISVKATAALKIKSPVFPLSATMVAKFSAKPRYEPSNHGLYLDDMQLEDVQLTPEKLQTLINPVARDFANQAKGLLQLQPIYVLDDSKATEAKIASMTKSIKVEPGQLILMFK
ncbi:DUF1439 domain-containing protein [Shewanella sp. C32]|uniref:DUF1439 domain-containing protein n=1 Tax=Shewanella electrica TaxID=515560 RepID=A0ABT2FPN8_9GAMM|nr:DUF1439 domain-containing protein [Shewanella electrica]MCH1926751.1 DUF1439 domain-containing protein [Shewanella electrica]MCS4558311.1 DUF1439 domain-containing protein [Shewanella electrica]